MYKDVFKLAHDDRFHPGVATTLDNLKGFVIRHKARETQTYVDNCPDCQQIGTDKRKSHGEL